MSNYRKSLRYLPFITLLAAMGCADNDTKPDCEENARWCNNNNLMVCLNGAVSVQQYCNSEQVCDEASESCKPKPATSKCVDGNWQCTDNHLMLCQNGNWSEQSDCSAGNKVCNAAAHTCEGGSTTVVCNNGQKICSNNAVMECENNAYGKLVLQCANDQSCNSTTFQCDDKSTQKCSDNEVKCVGNTPMVCSDNEWVAQNPCGQDETCNDETGACDGHSTFKCNDDEVKCVGNTPMVCSDNAWIAQNPCGANETCNDLTGACDKNGDAPRFCNDGDKICLNNAVMECQDNAYGKLVTQCTTEQSCNSSTFACDDQVLFVCSDGAVKCTGNTPMLCSDNTWVPQTACASNETCNDTTGTCDRVACTAGAASCDSSNTLTYCDSYGQEQTRKCTGSTKCDATVVDCIDPETGKCTVNGKKIENGATLCSNGNLITCNNGSTDTQSCGYGVCRNGETSCSDYKTCSVGSNTVAHNAQVCSSDGKSVVRCNDGKLDTVTSCSGKTVCMASGSSYSCEEPPAVTCKLGSTTISEGAYICDSNKLRMCTSSGLNAGTDCASNGNGKSKCSVDKCVAATCTVGDTTIASGSTTCNADGTQKVKCEDGKLNTVSTGACTSSQICQIDGGTPTCVDKGKSYTKIADIWKDYNLIADGSCASKASFVKPANVDITGVITYINSTGVLFVQDPNVSNAQHAGIMVSCAGGACDANIMKQLSIGKKIRIVADGVGYSYCQLQVRSNTSGGIQITQSGTGNVAAFSIDAVHINRGADNLYNSSLVSLSNVTITGAASGGYGAQDTSGWFKISTDAYAATLSGKINVTGIVKYINNESVLMPRQASDIQTIECTGSESKCTDGKLYTCSGNKWNTGTPCTTSTANANPVCKSNVCSFECKEGYYLKNSKCEKIETTKKDCTDFVSKKTVKHGSVGCSTASAAATCDDGNWTNTDTCGGPANSTASCNAGACSWTCQSGFEQNGELCVPMSCTSKGGSLVASGNKGCADKGEASGKLATCQNGTWINPQVCPNGCDPTINACASKIDTPISWCIFNYLDENTDHVAFMQIAPQEVEYTPYFKCTTEPTKAVNEWSTTIRATDNASFNCGYDCHNKEYMSAAADMPSEEGTYTCVAMIDVKNGYSYICPTEDHGADTNVVRMNSGIVPDGSQTRSYTVSPFVANPVKWCKFAIGYQDSEDRIAFIQFLPPDGMTASEVTAKTICTMDSDYATKPISEWDFSVDTKTVNTSCGDCGSTNTEYMTNKGDLSNDKGLHHCVGVVSVKGGNSYVCPTDPSKTPVLYNDDTKANDPHATEWGYTAN